MFIRGVAKLDVGKLESRAEECRFVVFDSESKAFRVYWPGKNRVSIERDVYFNEKEALESDEVQIEGETDILPNSTRPQVSQHTETSPPTKTNQINADITPNEAEIPKFPHDNPTTPPSANSDFSHFFP